MVSEGLHLECGIEGFGFTINPVNHDLKRRRPKHPEFNWSSGISRSYIEFRFGGLLFWVWGGLRENLRKFQRSTRYDREDWGRPDTQGF